MKKIFKTYKSVIILLAAIIIGAIIGIACKEKAAVLKPFGDLFLNLLFVTIVPLIFLSITTSISKIKQLFAFLILMYSKPYIKIIQQIFYSQIMNKKHI